MPCFCGDTECPSCGVAQGTRGAIPMRTCPGCDLPLTMNDSACGMRGTDPMTSRGATKQICPETNGYSTTDGQCSECGGVHAHTPQWAAQHTAGHDIHGQTAIYDEITGRDIAIVYDGDAHAELIVQAVNSHAELIKALEGVLHHNAGTKPEYQLPQSLVRHVESALAKARG